MIVQAPLPAPIPCLQLGLPDNLVIGLTIGPDLILRLPIAGGKQGNNLVSAEPDLIERIVCGIADMLSDGIAMRSHDRILSYLSYSSMNYSILPHVKLRYTNPIYLDLFITAAVNSLLQPHMKSRWTFNLRLSLSAKVEI
ncbi:hypothetical protein [Microvirga sp. BSC39]|uniref:hypothetical protein n=1 Tax=Microvirga sp. BSC39 TaxID=1549810 RepID=UPI00126A40FE|nr:hypothetical protein [Microvirga sp. BSC39]